MKKMIALILIGFVSLVFSQLSIAADDLSHLDNLVEGYKVYKTTCARCHDSGLNGAPVKGNPAGWSSRSTEWPLVLKSHAVNGFLQMPAKGDNAKLAENEVSAAVDYIISEIRTLPSLTIDHILIRGRNVYMMNCAGCHNTGKQGAPTLYDLKIRNRGLFARGSYQQHVNKGWLLMPPRGGKSRLTKKDLNAAIEYILNW